MDCRVENLVKIRELCREMCIFAVLKNRTARLYINTNYNMKKFTHLSLLLMLALLVGLTATAAAPSNYYNNAKGKSDQALMAALHSIIKGHTKRSYDQLWTDFRTTDCNGSIIIDRYSDSQFTYNTDKCGNYSGVGDCYNREHSIPNSWWGGDDTDTAYTDLHHMFPTDGFVNSKRGDNPFGDCRSGTTYGTGILGPCATSGYSGTVFEVADEYKGDFARVYFYFATRYMKRMSNYTSGKGNIVFTSSSYLGLTTWAINQLLAGHRNDPVSALETTRNDKVYSLQHNRNPFVDNPELVEYIWGNMKGNAWNAGTTPVLSSPANGTTVNVGTNTGNGVSKTITVKGTNLTKSLTLTVSGTGFSVTPTTVTASAANTGTTVTVTYNGTATSATGTLTISSTEVSSRVNLTASYDDGGGSGTVEETVETWEGCTTGGYWTQTVQGHAFSWSFNNAGIYSDDTNKNGTRTCRFGKNNNSSISMNEDLSSGASKVTFYAANWSGDGTPTIQLQYSTDGGSTWTTAATCTLNNTWKQYSYDLNVTGNVRFKIAQTAGSRLNIDDIAITSNGGSAPPPVNNPRITSPADGSTVNVGTISATGTSVSRSLTIKGSELTQALSLAVTGTGFRVSSATVTAAAANNGTNVIITYSSSVAGDATGTLTIISSEVSVTVNLTASKLASASLAITSLDAIEAVQDGESSVVQGSVTSENNTAAITLSVDGNFELSLNQYTWAKTLTLDADGEVFYVRLADTGTIGDFYGSISAAAGSASAYADVEGTVAAKPVLKGDVDMNGTVGIGDVTSLVDYVLNGYANPFDIDAADVDDSGSISIGDITMLIDMILNGSESLSVRKWTAVPIDGMIEINNRNGELLEVYDIDAEIVAEIKTAGMHRLSVPAGVYLVSGKNDSRKVVIK